MSLKIASVLRKHEALSDLIVDMFHVVGGDREKFYAEAGIDRITAVSPPLHVDVGLRLTPIERFERDVVAGLVHHLHRRGFDVIGVERDYRLHAVDGMLSAMEMVFDRSRSELETTALVFQQNGERPHSVLLDVNAGYGIIGNHTYGYNDVDGFDAAMKSFKTKEKLQ